MNDTTLIVPDVHERVQTVKQLLDRYLGKIADRAIFLGDYFDSFLRTPGSTRNTIALVQDLLTDDRCDLLLGNHDLHYLYPHMGCSGYHADTYAMVNVLFTPQERASLKDLHTRTAIQRGGFLISHAGFHPDLVPITGYSDQWLHKLTERATKRQLDHGGLFAVGRERGGADKYGGPFWLGWEEFVDDPALPPQIVGHTERRDVRWQGRSVCLDTSLRYVALLRDDGTLTIQDV